MCHSASNNNVFSIKNNCNESMSVNAQKCSNIFFDLEEAKHSSNDDSYDELTDLLYLI